MSESPHETVARVLEEESQGYDSSTTVEKMRRHVAYVDKLRADRAYLARCMHNCVEASAKTRAYYNENIAKLEEQVAQLKEQWANAKR